MVDCYIPRSYTAIAIAIVIAGVLISASLYVAVEVPTRTTTTTTITDTFAQTTIVLSTVSSASCDYVIPAPCPSDENFTLSVNYTGPWTVKYQGYNEQCYTQRNSTSNCNSDYETLNGSYDGSGSNSRNITVSGQGNGWTFCAQAQKSDASGSILILEVSGDQNKTSLPFFGITSTCSEELLL